MRRSYRQFYENDRGKDKTKPNHAITFVTQFIASHASKTD
jgi:hypothetical protein